MAKRDSKNEEKTRLNAAFDAYQAGDVVRARSLAREVLAAPTADDSKAAHKLAGVLGCEDSVAAVANELAARTNPPLKAYLLAGAAAATCAFLVVLAQLRY